LDTFNDLNLHDRSIDVSPNPDEQHSNQGLVTHLWTYREDH